MKKCSMCHRELPLDAFRGKSASKDGKAPHCRECDNARKRKWRENNRERSSEYMRAYKKTWNAQNPEKLRVYAKKVDLKRKYGISLDQYQSMWDRQSGRCAICGKHDSEEVYSLSVDHDHFSGQVRELLCSNCNRGIGHLQEDIRIMQEAIKYLEKHRCS